jgi:hypothetical protein
VVALVGVDIYPITHFHTFRVTSISDYLPAETGAHHLSELLQNQKRLPLAVGARYAERS